MKRPPPATTSPIPKIAIKPTKGVRVTPLALIMPTAGIIIVSPATTRARSIVQLPENMNAPATRTIPHTAWTDRRMAERETGIIGSNSDVRARASKKSPRNAELYGAILDLKWFGCGALHQRPEPGPRRGERRRRPSRAVSVSHRAPWLTAHTTKIPPKATPLSHRPVIGLMESTRGSVIGAEAMARYSRVRYGNKTAR